MTTTERRSAWRTTLLPVIGILVVVILALVLIKSQMGRLSGGEHGGVQIGQVAPDFDLIQVGGPETKLSTIKAKVILINFWASWCDGCLAEMPSIASLWQNFRDKGFEVVSINVEENPEATVPRAISRLRIPFPVYVDRGQAASTIFEVSGLPHSVILDKGRKLLFIETGARNWDDQGSRTQLEKWLNQ